MEQYKVFVSHGSDDTYLVSKLLVPPLDESGASVFVDSGAIDVGDDYREILIKEIRDSHELVVMLTSSSIQRPWVIAEIAAFVFASKRVVPLVYGVDESRLQETGITSLLGHVSPIKLEQLDDYIGQLGERVGRASHV